MYVQSGGGGVKGRQPYSGSTLFRYDVSRGNAFSFYIYILYALLRPSNGMCFHIITFSRLRLSCDRCARHILQKKTEARLAVLSISSFMGGLKRAFPFLKGLYSTGTVYLPLESFYSPFSPFWNELFTGVFKTTCLKRNF